MFKRFLLMVALVVGLSTAAASSVFVGANYDMNNFSGVVEVAVEGEDNASLLFGVSVGMDLSVEASVGVAGQVAKAGTSAFSLAFRAHLPVFDGSSFSPGDFALSGGVIWQLQPENTRLMPTFEAGMRSDINSIPQGFGWYFRAGVGFDF